MASSSFIFFQCAFLNVCKGKVMRMWGVMVYMLLSQMDMYLGGHSNVLTGAVRGFSRTKKKTEVVECGKRKQVETEED